MTAETFRPAHPLLRKGSCVEERIAEIENAQPNRIGQVWVDAGWLTVPEARELRDWLNSVLPAQEDTAVSQFAERLKDRIHEIREGVGAGRYAEGASMERQVCNPVLDAVIDAIDEELT